MALVKFYRGTREKYDAGSHADGVYFSTDTGEIIMNDVAYGYNAADHREVSAVDYVAPDTITVTYANGESDVVTLQTAVAGGTAEESTPGLISADDIYNLAKVQEDLAREIEDRTAADEALQESVNSTGDAVAAEQERAEAAEQALQDTIDAMDVADNAVVGEYVTAVSQEDGVISVSRSAIVLDYNSGTKVLQLKNGDGTEFGGIDASEFIKDGMIESASFDSDTSKISLVFNTDSGKDTIEIDVSSLVDTYANSDGSLTVDGYVIDHSNTIAAGTTDFTETSTLDYGGSFVVPTVTYDANGHITATGSVTITLPAEVTLAELEGIDAITVTGDDYLTLSAEKTDTSVAITGAVDISADYYDKTEIDEKESALQAEVDATQSGAGLAEDGSYVADGDDAILGSATSLASANTLLSTAVTEETARATAAEEANAAAIATETARAEAAESALASDLASEASRATAAEEANATAISDETTRATEAETALSEQITALSDSLEHEDSYASGEFVGAVSVKDGEVTVEKKALSLVYDSETDDLSISDGTDNFTTVSLYGLSDAVAKEAAAREEADAALREAIDTEVTDREEAIAALDYEDAAVARQFVTSVSEADGVISVTRGAITSADGTVTIADGSDGGVDIAANIDGSTIVKDASGVLSVASSALTQYVGENAIAISDANADNDKTVSLTIADGDLFLTNDSTGLYATLSIQSVTSGLGENVKEAFVLTDKNGNQVGEQINIYKDASLDSVTLEDQSLVFVYNLADGTQSTVSVDVSSFLAESEFADGLQVVDHVVSVKVDAASEDFLSVSSEGVKVSGVQDAIDAEATAREEADAALQEAIDGLGENLDEFEAITTDEVDELATAVFGDLYDPDAADNMTTMTDAEVTQLYQDIYE